LLEGLGHKVVLAHPLKTKMIAEAKIKIELRRRNLKYQDGAGIFMGKWKKWLCNLKNPAIDSYLAIYEAVDRELKNAEREIEKAFSYAGLVPRVHQSGNTSY
jgi:transposase